MKKIILIIVVIFTSYIANSQDFKFGKVSLEEVQSNVYSKDTSAKAVILYKSRNTYFNHDHPDGWVIITEIHERIKILTKDGLDYGTKKIPLFNSGRDNERTGVIKAYTYNEEGGKLKSEKLEKSTIFKNQKSDSWSETSFTMPNVKVGSVVEWTYTISSPFWKIDDLIIQDDIPTAYYFAKIETLSYFKFNRMVKGYFNISPKEYDEPRNLNVSWEQSTNRSLTQATKSATIQTTEYVSEYELKDIPALKEEPYVDNIDNYRFLVTYELVSTHFPNGNIKNYASTWNEVVKTINDSKYFGDQLNNTNFLKDDAENLIKMGSSKMIILNNAFNYVRDKMSWNGNYGKYVDDGIRKAYKDNLGNVSEINLLLVALLRECGIPANPVLVSTRNHGIPVFPTLEGFNYVIACVQMGEDEILLDATEKSNAPGMLPERAINWEGILVFDNNQSRKINLYPKNLSNINTIMNVTINEDGSLEGKQRSNYTDMEALDYRINYKKFNNEQYIENIINTYAFNELTDFKVENINDSSQPIVEGFTFEYDNGADVIGNEIYFSPLLFLKIETNPFKLNERNYPVNFVYPQSRKKIINIKIPQGYQVSSLPKPIKISLPDEQGSYLFNISESNGSINVITIFTINSTIIPTQNYLELKEFYKQRVMKEAEKIVLIKM